MKVINKMLKKRAIHFTHNLNIYIEVNEIGAETLKNCQVKDCDKLAKFRINLLGTTVDHIAFINCVCEDHEDKIGDIREGVKFYEGIK